VPGTFFWHLFEQAKTWDVIELVAMAMGEPKA
jgi:hypothetical protein